MARTFPKFIRLRSGVMTQTGSSPNLTAVDGGTNASGHFFALRWGHATALFRLKKIRVNFQPLATATYEAGFDVVVVQGYTVAHTNGTQLTTANVGKMDSNDPDSLVSDIRIGDTGDLSGGTIGSYEVMPLGMKGYHQLTGTVARASDPVTVLEIEDIPRVLRQNQGIIIRNRLALGAGATVRAHVSLWWDETTFATQDQ